ncbi:putative sulfate exporter family transporter [Hymenobacter sp. M29]|uniref:Sulfate exporter family transporter n=1 Tax=Hymenobacter mellowenesis TaxID=3063995 RepID=A0ABT9AH45_9BACT|nr:putative sulfate exporter family transporter [Hymenobacter sp. M29]MDO7849193.1 putative sulfate exporter family transporter [Hymenobacter sp. M29]
MSTPTTAPPQPAPQPAAPVAPAADTAAEAARRSRFSEGLHAPHRLFGWEFSLQQVVFSVVLVFCLTPWASPPLALALGLVLAQTVGNPFAQQTKGLTQKLLQFSVIGLGFGMNAHAAVQAGREGILFTVVSLVGTLGLGYFVGRWLGLGRTVVHLISCGTAICGGSAIAAVAPVLRAKDEEISVALGTVFVLNALALFAFPPIGHALALTQNQFGLWCAIAIHDTSSVVGAAAAYGAQALQVATTVKLARALWIIPVSICTALAFRQRGVKVKLPYFIAGFIAAMLLNTYVPAVRPLAPFITHLAKIGLTVTLFFIGAGLSARAIRAVGGRPFVLGVVLWVVISLSSLYVILHAA